MGQLMRRVRCVGRIAIVMLQCRQRADQIVAGVENRQSGTNGAVRILARVPSAPLRGELNNRAKRDTIILNFQFSILNERKNSKSN